MKEHDAKYKITRETRESDLKGITQVNSRTIFEDCEKNWSCLQDLKWIYLLFILIIKNAVKLIYQQQRFQ